MKFVSRIRLVSVPAAYPEKPINMVIAFTADGASDVQARIMQKNWNKYAPQPWVFVYKPGAGASSALPQSPRPGRTATPSAA